MALKLLKILRELPHVLRKLFYVSHTVGLTAPELVAISRPANSREVERSGPLIQVHTACHEAFNEPSIPHLDCLNS